MNKILSFPKGFFWGASTAAHQVEGGNFNNDWWKFEQEGKIKDGSSAKIACNHYHLFDKDFALAQKLGHNSHRLSIEWSRIQPRPGVWDKEEVGHYRKVLKSLKKHGLVSFVTLHHFTNPLWFARIGGWENPKSPEIFTRYVKFCVQNFGDLVDFWLTVNEPQVIVGQGYFLGYWPPEKRNPFVAWKVAKNLMTAHRLAYQEIHRLQNKAKVSFAYPKNFVVPENKWSLLAIWGTKIYKYFHDFWFLHQAKDTLDFIGLNYYHYVKLRLIPFKIIDGGAKGIFGVISSLKKFNLPIYITENGTSDNEDTQRPRFILEHLHWLWKAIREGADVRGYLHWTLMDNFEWQEGISMRFGLCHTNFKTLKRTPRKSAKMYKEICQANAITENIVKKYQPKLLKEIFR